MEFRFVISLIFAIIVALFAILNSGVVTISFLFAEFQVSQALVILISATLGAIIVMLLGAVKQYKLQRKNKDQAKTIEQLEAELKVFNDRIESSVKTETLQDNPSEEINDTKDIPK